MVGDTAVAELRGTLTEVVLAANDGRFPEVRPGP